MRSAPPEPSAPRSLGRRMVWMSLMAAVAGAAVASLGSALTATELLLLQEEGIALRAAARLSEETIEEREETIRELGGHFADDGDDDLSALERMDPTERERFRSGIAEAEAKLDAARAQQAAAMARHAMERARAAEARRLRLVEEAHMAEINRQLAELNVINHTAGG